MKAKKLEAIHPGEILFEDFMKPMGISINRLSRDIMVPPNRVSAIVNGNRAITADTALRLGKYFGVSPKFGLACRRITNCDWPGVAHGPKSRIAFMPWLLRFRK